MQGGAGGRPPWAWRARYVAETVVCVDRGRADPEPEQPDVRYVRRKVRCRATPKCSLKKLTRKMPWQNERTKKVERALGHGLTQMPIFQPVPGVPSAPSPMRHARNGHDCACVVPCLSHMSSLPTLARLRFATTSKRHRAPWRRTWQPGSCDGSCPPASVCGEAIDGATPS